MTPERFEQIKKDIEVQKTKKIQAETKLESLFADLKKNFDIDTLEEAETLLSEYEEKSETLKAKKEKLESQLEELMEDVDD